MRTWMMLQRYSGPDGSWIIKATSLTFGEVCDIIQGEDLEVDQTGIPIGDPTWQVSRRSKGDGAQKVYCRFILDQDTDVGDIGAQE